VFIFQLDDDIVHSKAVRPLAALILDFCPFSRRQLCFHLHRLKVAQFWPSVDFIALTSTSIFTNQTRASASMQLDVGRRSFSGIRRARVSA